MAVRKSSPKLGLKKTNDIPLTSEYLLVVLSDLSSRIQQFFGSMAPVNLVVHGGAVMVLHSGLQTRAQTLDIDYLHRGFEAEWKQRGLHDAGARLRKCIAETAARFDLGADWMNAHADVALPFTVDSKSQEPYDYVWHATMSEQNVIDNTIYSSPTLNLIAVPWCWGVALKLVRYQKHDPFDIACILVRGKKIKAVEKWDVRTVERWLAKECGVMGYSAYSPQQVQVNRDRVKHAILFASSIEIHGKTRSMELYKNQQLVQAMTNAPFHTMPVR
ncbi:hypothetical protein EIP91_003328 [Steccherinum ochraceum]|uniref:Uncharacterized protein n=1 Tax=Steccherinum ochraceum TaxID=92696 RepID=A0A4V2MW59_9APHY|nr:hypothetical protein EIP91_003328 [Steccherinum ochraceum]